MIQKKRVWPSGIPDAPAVSLQRHGACPGGEKEELFFWGVVFNGQSESGIE
jgi:hypothetical protein